MLSLTVKVVDSMAQLSSGDSYINDGLRGQFCLFSGKNDVVRVPVLATIRE